MINRLIDFSARNQFLVLLLVAAAAVCGYWSSRTLRVDALPELGDTQVIVYSHWEHSPDLVEAQVTYPIVSAMLGAPHVKSVRGFSDFGYSYVYVIFQDGTDLYWARSRTLEYLAGVLSRLPKDVKTELGPDATGLGWVYQYALVDHSGKRSLAELRSYQDWYLKYYLKSVPGVAEVAAVGGFGQQYQINVDPNRLRQYRVSIGRVVDAVRSGNSDLGGRLLEFGGTEYMVRGRGFVKSVEDIEQIALGASDTGTPIRIKDLGQVTIGPELRRGVADLDGTGDAVSGIIIMRQGENALDVIDRVKAKIREIEPGLPAGVRILPVYDRSDLIRRSISSVKQTLIEVTAIVALIILLFLWHFPSAILPLITIPAAVLISFIPLRLLGINANIMSLGGIAIAIGALVDGAIVVVEQTHKKLDLCKKSGRPFDPRAVVIEAIKEVAGPSFFALLVISVSFLPVLTLEAQEGRLFKPLAYTKSLAMIVAALLTITLDPALRLLLMRLRVRRFRPIWLHRLLNNIVAGPIHSEEKHPVSRALIRIYQPVLDWTLRWKSVVIMGALLVLICTIPIYRKLGSEFMPPLDEGSLLYMPATMPGISIGEAKKLLQVTDRIIKQFPEVDHVLGKAGRAETPTDPAPLSMLETVITLRPKSEWPRIPTWYSAAPEWIKPALRHITPDHISQDELIRQMDAALRLPGVSNSWTMPIKGRLDMLTTGMRTTVGLKISGSDMGVIQKIGAEIEAVLPGVQGTRSVFAERPAEGYFLDVNWDRKQLARYGLSIADAQVSVENAIGGENVSTIIQGRERYPINVRYMRDFRSDIATLGRVLVPVPGGEKQIEMGQLGSIQVVKGPSMIRDEDGLLTSYVYVDLDGRDPRGYIEEANRVIRGRITQRPGYSMSWSGQYEAIERTSKRLKVVVPLTIALICLLLYLNTRSFSKTLIVMLAVPFSAIGALWFLYLLGYHMSVSVGVGLIALLGIDAETGVFMLLYLDLAYQQAKTEGKLRNRAELRSAIRYGAEKRIRPKFMTVTTVLAGLLPVMWATGAGADLMRRIAAPMIGGITTSFILEMLIYPAIYELWKANFELNREWKAPQEEMAASPALLVPPSMCLDEM